MTLSNRYLIAFNEIQALRITCTKCKGSMSVSIDKTSNIPERCQLCTDHQLFQSNGAEHNAVLSLLDRLVTLRDSKLTTYQIAFEVNADGVKV
jgi:hypothetical protein